MRRFQLHREVDTSGISGTGIVAEGVAFTDGTCVLRWLTATASTACYASADDVETVHGHGGRTRLVWLDSGAITAITPDCGCDVVQTLGGNGHSIEVHHVIPDDGSPHSESLECGCAPQLHLKPPDLLVADHVDQDAPLDD